MEKPESFEVQEYSDERNPYEKYQILKQIMEDYKNDSQITTCSFKLDFVGDQIKVTYMTYEMALPQRMKEVESQSKDAHREMLKHLKKEYKSRAKSSIKLTEQKDKADYNVQKVSLNERYTYISWKFYSLD